MRSWWRGTTGAAGLARFVTMGMVANGVFTATFLGVSTMSDDHGLIPNLVATITSTMAANDLHRRYSFQARDSVSWIRGQRVGGFAAVLSLVASSVALAAWSWWAPDSGSVASLGLVYLVKGACGLGSFATLRWALVDTPQARFEDARQVR